MLTAKQSAYVREATHRWNIKTGATGSGKTYMDIVYTIPARLRERHGLPGLNLLMGNTRGTLQRNVLDPLREVFSPALVSNIRSDNTATLFGEECYCLGADKINQVSKIQGATVKYCYGDEVTTWHENVFIMLKSRLRTPVSCFDGTCNPDTPQHWLKKFLDSNGDIYHQSYVIDDNPNLPTDFVENLKREYAGTVYYDRFILGRWVAAEGVIYRNFSASLSSSGNKSFLWPSQKQIPLMKVTIGVDFGGNGSQHAFVASGFLHHYGGVVALQSERLPAENSTPQTLSEAVLTFCESVFARFGRIDAIYCDSAEQVLIRGVRQHLRASSLPWLADKVANAAKTEINNRIRLTCILMGSGRFWYLTQAASLRDALAHALWSGKTPGKDERLDDGSTDIDSLDAFEYTIERDTKRLLQQEE